MKLRLAAGFVAAWVAFAGVRLDYDPGRGLEPSDPRLGLGFFSTPTGAASFSGPLVTLDADTTDYRGGGGRYYRCIFNATEMDGAGIHITVTVRVLSSVGSPAATCVQFTTLEGRTFGLGFLKGEVLLYADDGGALPQFKETYSGQDWLREPRVLARRPLDVHRRHTYVLELRRSHPDLIRLSIAGAQFAPMTAKLSDLKMRAAVPGSAQPEKTVQLCYAESPDMGLSWRKPHFNVVPFDGVAPTNIVYRPRYANLAGPFVLFDERDPDPSRRYKLFTSDYGDASAGSAAPPGIDVAFSPDGVHWRRSPLNPVLPLLSDTAQSVVWDARIGRYVAFVRMRPRGFGRAVGRTESIDFEHWSPPELVFATRRQEFYAMGVTSYEGLYIGTPWIIYNDKKDPMLPPPIMEAELGFSRDGWTWTRAFPGTPFLGVGAPGSPDEKQIRMSSSLIVLRDRILCLYGMSRDVHVSNMRVEVGLATLRLDGFVGMTAGEFEGVLETKPFVVEGNRLEINADAREGEIAVAALDARGRPISGYEASRCCKIREDGLHLSAAWDSHQEFARLRGKVVRLRFALRRARLYSFQLAP